jgi:hypothetical protein
MDSTLKATLWQQFGAAIDMLENAITACPDRLWGDRALQPEFWYTAYHAIFWLDYYLSESEKKFSPPPPFTLSELDPAGVLPDRVYTRDELLTYLHHDRAKCRTAIEQLTDESGRERSTFSRPELTLLELHFYNMRHVQHHAAQLNLLLRQSAIDAPRWVKATTAAAGKW